MPLDIRRLSQLRPYLYHLTAEQNLASIGRLRELRCARLLLESANLAHLASKRRTEHLSILSSSESLLIRDQKPLAAGAIAFEDGWNLERFIQLVNEHVFFWPGDSAGPIPAGLNHFKRYEGEALTVIRVPTTDLAPCKVAYSRYNSGAPRCSHGKHSPRGDGTYVLSDRFDWAPFQVVEVVAVHTCPLPPNAEVAATPFGPWHLLQSTADP